MRHLIFRGSFLKGILTIASALTVICVPGAVGQRGGAHVGGGGVGHFPSAGQVAHPPMTAPRAPGAPRPVQAPPPPRPVAPPRPAAMPPSPRPAMPWRPATVSPPPGPRRLGQPPAAGFGAPGFRPQLIPPKRLPLPRPTLIPPVAPIFSYPVFFPQPFFFGLGSGFNALWWQGCGPFSLWYWGCNGAPFYGYGFGNYLSGSSGLYEPYSSQPYEVPAYQPLYLYSGQPRDLAELYLKDGTVYDVTDYWVVNDELHFTTTEGDKSVEHVIPFDDLDLQKTIDVNTERGFHFTLRNEPIEQYLEDHPEIGSSTLTTPPVREPQTPASPGAPAVPTGTQPSAPQTDSPVSPQP